MAQAMFSWQLWCKFVGMALDCQTSLKFQSAIVFSQTPESPCIVVTKANYNVNMAALSPALHNNGYLRESAIRIADMRIKRFSLFKQSMQIVVSAYTCNTS